MRGAHNGRRNKEYKGTKKANGKESGLGTSRSENEFQFVKESLDLNTTDRLRMNFT